MYKLIFILLLAVSGRGWAQSDTGGVKVAVDPRVEQLIRKQIAINEATTLEARRHVPGFRIQVISSPDRNQVNAAKIKIYEEFPDWKPYLLYQAPNYKLRVGDFRTEDEANAAMQQLSRLFPSGLYVIRDIIEIKLSDVQKMDSTIR
ncbi:MAG TPA: SPOR domain-containing protein [Puia sp.]|nr:SPOR domain-containing protein [Puia sp.]